MTFDEYRATSVADPSLKTIESRVFAKLGGRLREFCLDNEGDCLILRGLANSYHTKQLAQHAVMSMTSKPILRNSIVVRR